GFQLCDPLAFSFIGLSVPYPAGGPCMRFNRNIIIQADIDKLLDPNSRNPKSLTASPPSGLIPTLAPAAAALADTAPQGGAAVGVGGAAPAGAGGGAVTPQGDYPP